MTTSGPTLEACHVGASSEAYLSASRNGHGNPKSQRQHDNRHPTGPSDDVPRGLLPRALGRGPPEDAASWSTRSSTSTPRSRCSTWPPPGTSPTNSGIDRITGRGGPRLPQVHPRIHVLQPRKWLPRVAGGFADRSLERQVLDAVGDLGLRNPAALDQRRLLRPLAVRTGWPTLYDITDDWLLAPLPPRQLARLTPERRCCSSSTADAVVVCSPDLARTRGRVRRVELIPNGVDVELFQTPQSTTRRSPAGPGGPLRRHPARRATRRQLAPRPGHAPDLLCPSCWSVPTPAQRGHRPPGAHGHRSVCSGPGPTTRSRRTSSTPTWSSSPTWSIRSPRASIRSRPTSAWPPAGPPWPRRSPDSASSGLPSR